MNRPLARTTVEELASPSVRSARICKNKLAALMPGADLASMIEASVTEKLERLEARRLGKVKNPRKSLEDADTSPGGRGIPAPVKRIVWARDQGQCTLPVVSTLSGRSSR